MLINQGWAKIGAQDKIDLKWDNQDKEGDSKEDLWEDQEDQCKDKE